MHHYLQSVNQVKNTPFYSNALIEELKEVVILQNENHYHDKISATQNSVAAAQNKIKEAFLSQKPLLIFGGWTGIPSGHAIYYEILPHLNDPHKATLRVYNTGAGIDHHSQVREGYKLKYQTYCEWQEIDRNKLESIHFLEALYELKSYTDLPFSSDQTTYNEQDIYLGLKTFLEPKQEISGPSIEMDADLCMSPQRTGVCSWRSLMAFVRTKMDLDTYKCFKCNIKLQSLLDYVEALPSQPTPLEWRLVRKSHQHLSRAIIKLYDAKRISDSYLKAAQENLQLVSNWIHAHASCRYKRHLPKVAFHYVPSAENQIVKNPHSLSQSLEQIRTSQQVENIAIQPHQDVIEVYNQMDLTRSDAIVANLEKVSSLSNQVWLNGEDLALHKGLIQTVSNLKLDEEFWRKAVEGQPQKAEALITKLGEMAHLFTKSCFTIPDAPIIFSEKIYFFHKIFYLQQLLCQLGHPDSSWKHVHPHPFPGLDKGHFQFFLRFAHAKMHREMETILQFLRSKLDAIEIHEQVNSSSTNLELTYRENLFPTSKSSFIDLIRQTYPEVIQKIAQNTPQFNKLPKFSQDAHISASSLLPDWIKALSHTHLDYLYLTQAPVGPLTALDRQADLQHIFQVKDEKDSSTITVNLKGVNGDILHTPQVNKIDKNPNLRYAAQYRKIVTEPIQDFISFLKDQTSLNEKQVIITSHENKRTVDRAKKKNLLKSFNKVKEFTKTIKGIKELNQFLTQQTAHKRAEIKMSNEEFKELAYLFTKSEFQLVETLEYFTKHPEKLQNSDYQTLFQSLLFQTGLLDKNLQVQGFEDHLAHFVQKNYELFLEQNEIPTTVFFLKLAHQLNGFCPEQPFFNTTSEKLHRLLQDKNLEAGAKSLIYAEWIAQLSHKQSLSEEEILTLLVGTVYIEENQAQNKYAKDPQTSKEVREAFLLHARQIQTVLEKGNPNQHFLNQFLKRIRPDIQEDKGWEMKIKAGEFPAFSTSEGDHLFYPLLSKLISSQAKVLLPLKIRQTPHFCQLFPRIEQGYFYPGNIFGFNDQQGCPTRVHMNGDRLIIEQKLDPQLDEWFRFIPSSSFVEEKEKEKEKDKSITSLLGSRYLVHHYTHWQSLTTHHIYALDPQTKKRRYLITTTSAENPNCTRVPGALNLKIQEIKSFSNNQAKLGQTSPLLTTFEDPAYIHEWYNEHGILKKIELPRFNLSFKPHPQAPDQLICKQFPQYTLNTTDSVPELGMHHRYILLQNSQGHRKVILPQQAFKAPEKKEVLLPRYELDQELEWEQLEPQKMLIFDIQKEGKLQNPSLEANLYLTQVLTTAQEYKKAAYYLKRWGEKLTDYTPNEIQILKDISNIQYVTGDTSGNGLILQLYATYLRIKNNFARHHEISQADDATLHELYPLYIQHYSHATIFKLKPQEEIFILKRLLENHFDAIYFLRLKELDPVAAQTVCLPSSSQLPPLQEKKPIDLKNFKVPYTVQRTNSNLNTPLHTLLTRPQKSIKHSFLYYYEIARKGSDEEKQRLRQSLHFLHVINKGQHRDIADFFEAVLDHPHSFPNPLMENASPTYQQITEWGEKLKEIAIAHLSSKTRTSLQPPLNVKEDTRKNRLIPLDEKQPTVAPFIPHYQLPALSAFAPICRAAKCFQKIPNTEQEQISAILFSLLQTYKNEDPVQNREVNRLIQDLETYQKKSPDPSYLLNEGGLDQIANILNQTKNEDQATLKHLEKNILALANKSSSSEIVNIQNHLKKWSGVRKVLKLEELIVNFARQDYKDLFQRNPALTEADVNLLAEMVGSFLLHATRQQQRTRAETILSQLQVLNAKHATDSQEYKDLTHQLAQEMLANRTFNPIERPAYLVFEYFAELLMRPTQVDKLEQFLKNGDLNLIMEMIMGSGKSKVLLPLLGLMRANGDDLSMLIVPAALFETISQETQSILHQAFAQSLRSLHFDRDTPFTKEALETILDDLQNIRQNQECLIMTSKSIQCLVLKYMEECTRHFEGPQKDQELPPELKTMCKIVSLLSEKGYPIIDEADFILNVLRETSFSRGKCSTPNADELNLSSELYHLLYTDVSLRQLAKLESDPTPDSKAPILTEQLYFAQVQQPLASALINRLDKISFASPSLTHKMQQFIQNLTPPQYLHLMHYLCRDKQHIDSAQHFYDSLDEEIQNILALAGVQLSLFLPHTLTRICKEKYGLDDKTSDIFAIHYAAADVPSSGSHFANSDITMNYTIQTYMKMGIPHELVEKQIKLLQEKAMREMASNGGRMSLKETRAYQAFTRIKGDVNIPLFNYQSIHMEELVQHINQSSATKLNFVSSIILPQLQNFEEKISCNAYNLMSLFNKETGFTGTLWNSLSMHHKLTALAEIGIDSKTLSILLKNSRTNVLSIQEGSTRSMLEQLKNQNVDYHMISDAGGYFKDKSNVEIAHEIARIKGQEVIAYNKKGEQIITESSEEILLTQSTKKPEERVTFLDQIHTTGADIHQKRDAVSLVTIGRNMLLRDLLQSVWRLRKLDQSQRVRFVVSSEVEGIIRQQLKLKAEEAISFDTILAFVIANQAAQQGRDNYKALKQGLDNLPQIILLKVLLNEKLDAQARLLAFTNLRSTWIKLTSLSSRELYGKLTADERSETVLELNKKQYSAKIEQLFTQMPWLEQISISKQACLDEIDLIIQCRKESVPTYLQTSATEDVLDQTTEIEKQTQLEKQNELEVQELSETEKVQLGVVDTSTYRIKQYPSFQAAVKALDKTVYKPKLSSDLKTFTLRTLPVFPLPSYLESDQELSPYAAAFEDVHISLNILEWTSEKTNFALLGTHRTDLHHLLIEDSHITLINQDDGKRLRTNSNYYNLTLGYNDPKQRPSLEQLTMIIKVKFLNGEAQFNSDEINLLKQWFQQHGASKMQKLYREHILKAHPQKSAHYEDSPLQQLFAEMC